MRDKYRVSRHQVQPYAESTKESALKSLRPFWGWCDEKHFFCPEEMDEGDIQGFVVDMIRDRGWSPGTLAKVMTYVIDWFHLWGIKLDKKKIRLPRQKTDLTKCDALSTDEIKEILAKAKNRNWEVAVWLSLFAGLRIKEVQNLRWTDIQWEKNRIHIRDSKSKEDRYVPIVGKLHKYLWWNNCWKRKRSPYVYSYAGKRIKHWPKAPYVLGIPGWHTLRRTFATRLHENGVPIEKIAKLLGHADPRTTMCYIRPDISAADIEKAFEWN